MDRLTALVVARPILVIVFCLFTALAGVLSLAGLTQQQYPNIDLPAIAVTAVYPGASTSEMRDAIVAPLENQIAGAPDLDHITSNVQNGQATITAVFVLGSDQTRNLAWIQKSVQQAQSQLPSDLPAPTITTTTLSASTVVSLVATSTSLDDGSLSAIVQSRIAPALSQLPGVSNVQVGGNVQPAIRVDVDPLQLAARDQTLTNIIASISDNNVRAPGGYVTSAVAETGIDIRGDIVDAPSVANLFIGSGRASNFGISPATVAIKDVARVYPGSEPAQTYAFNGTTRAVTLDVKKTTSASEVKVSKAVIAALPSIEAQNPGINVRVVAVQSDYSSQQISGAEHALIEAILFTAVIMLFFLRSWRHAVVVCIAIPTSLFVTFTVMQFAGFSIDTVSLAAMTLVIGILVDDSTVVLENIERHHHELGEDARTAAVRGRGEIALAAITLTLVDVSVFLPIAFLPGIIGKLLLEFGAVITISTLTSLLVGFTVTPALAGRWSLQSTWSPWRLIDAFNARFDALRDWYAHRALPWGLRHGRAVAAIGAVSLVLAVMLIPLGVIGFEFLPPDDRGELFVQVTMPSGTALDATKESALLVTRNIEANPDVRQTVTLAGGYQPSFGGTVQQRNIFQVHVFLKEHRKQSTQHWSDVFAADAMKLVPHAMAVAIPATGLNGGPSQPIDSSVSVTGSGDPTAAGIRVAEAFRRAAGATMVTSSASVPAPHIDVEFDRNRAAALDVSEGAAATAMRAAFGGLRAAQYENALGLNYVEVIYPAPLRDSLAGLTAIPLSAQNGATVYAGDIARFVDTPTPPLITRINRRQVVDVSANIAPGYVASTVQQNIARELAAAKLPKSVIVGPSPSGNQQNLSDLTHGIGISLVLSTSIVYLLMVALYDGFKTPFIIMFAVPLAATGALGGLALLHQSLNLFSMIGIVLLIGLVVKNGILLVDFANQLRAKGRSARDAIRESARLRFRPIVMTTVSMIVGMLPIALALDPGSGNRRSLGIAVIGGLLSSLVLTLLLVPVIYSWMSRGETA